jgi:hypothetical protein
VTIGRSERLRRVAGRWFRDGSPRPIHLCRDCGRRRGLAQAGCGNWPDRSTSQTAPLKAWEATTAPNNTAGPAAVDQEIQELTGFVSPTGNVACMMDASWARCDIVDRDWSPPPRPADCESDYRQGLSVAPGGPAQFVCAGDTVFGPDEVLPYGESITADRVRCENAESGITCLDTESGHGFSISREAYRLF